MEKIEILSVPFAKITQAEAVELLEKFLHKKNNHVVVTPNPEGVMQARRNAAFAEALQNAELSLADGTGIVLASVFLRKKLPQRVRGVDTTLAFFEKISQETRTVYLLGGAPGVAEKAKENLATRFPNLTVIGFHHGFFSPDDEAHILSEINRLAPDILLVCMGMPRAEIWAHKHKKINARVTLCVGGTLDIIAGTAKLAPPLMGKLGLEWLSRLARQPSRARRMLDIPRFIFAVVFRR